MRRLVLLFALAGCDAEPIAQPHQALNAAELAMHPRARGLPAEAQALVVRHDRCLARRAALATADEVRAMAAKREAASTCAGLDSDKAALIAAYARDAGIAGRLRRLRDVEG